MVVQQGPVLTQLSKNLAIKTVIIIIIIIKNESAVQG